jgi:hypothetical protein
VKMSWSLLIPGGHPMLGAVLGPVKWKVLIPAKVALTTSNGPKLAIEFGLLARVQPFSYSCWGVWRSTWLQKRPIPATTTTMVSSLVGAGSVVVVGIVGVAGVLVSCHEGSLLLFSCCCCSCCSRERESLLLGFVCCRCVVLL